MVALVGGGPRVAPFNKIACRGLFLTTAVAGAAWGLAIAGEPFVVSPLSPEPLHKELPLPDGVPGSGGTTTEADVDEEELALAGMVQSF